MLKHGPVGSEHLDEALYFDETSLDGRWHRSWFLRSRVIADSIRDHWHRLMLLASRMVPKIV